MTLIRTGYPQYCAHFPGGDPRRFEPDPDGVTPAGPACSSAAWQAASQAASSAAELEGSVFYETGPGWAVRGHVAMFGPGTYFYPEDFMDEEDREEAENGD